jgi:hypothetical protein
MPISVESCRKGGTGEALVAAARKGKHVWEKHGAEFFVSQIMAGPDSGQWVSVVQHANWEAFGKGMQTAMNDPALQEFLSELGAFSELVSRRVLVSVDV